MSRHPALGGPPDGTLRFGWGWANGDQAVSEPGKGAAVEDRTGAAVQT
jgi:hypothetical protein